MRLLRKNILSSMLNQNKFKVKIKNTKKKSQVPDKYMLKFEEEKNCSYGHIQY